MFDCLFVCVCRVSELGETSCSPGIDGQPTPSDSIGGATIANDGAATISASPLSPLDRKGVALGCFVLARCLQLGQAVTKNDEKAHEYYTKAVRFDKQVVAELHDKLTHGQL